MNKFHGEKAPAQKGVYAEILTELTGELVTVPTESPLSEGLVAENERFQATNHALRLLENLPKRMPLIDCVENKLRDNPRFNSLHMALMSLGFQTTGF